MDWGAWWTTVHGVTKEMDTTWHLNNNNALGWLLLLFSCSVMSNCLWPHGLQHHPSPSPGAYWNSCPLSRWCLPTVLSSVLPFSSCPQSFLALGSFLMSQLFTSGDQNIGVSASASVLSVSIQGWFPLGWLVGSPCSPRALKSLLQHHSWKVPVLWCSAFFMVQVSHPYMTTGNTMLFSH